MGTLKRTFSQATESDQKRSALSLYCTDFPDRNKGVINAGFTLCKQCVRILDGRKTCRSNLVEVNLLKYGCLRGCPEAHRMIMTQQRLPVRHSFMHESAQLFDSDNAQALPTEGGHHSSMTLTTLQQPAADNIYSDTSMYMQHYMQFHAPHEPRHSTENCAYDFLESSGAAVPLHPAVFSPRQTSFMNTDEHRTVTEYSSCLKSGQCILSSSPGTVLHTGYDTGSLLDASSHCPDALFYTHSPTFDGSKRPEADKSINAGPSCFETSSTVIHRNFHVPSCCILQSQLASKHCLNLDRASNSRI